MKYQIFLTPQANNDLNVLEEKDKKKIFKTIDVIENVDLQAVYNKSLGNKLYEIKVDNIRCLYGYKKGQIIIIALIFVKKTQKTPKLFIEKAQKILKEYQE
jgi:phage-related protein